LGINNLSELFASFFFLKKRTLGNPRQSKAYILLDAEISKAKDSLLSIRRYTYRLIRPRADLYPDRSVFLLQSILCSKCTRERISRPAGTMIHFDAGPGRDYGPDMAFTVPNWFKRKLQYRDSLKLSTSPTVNIFRMDSNNQIHLSWSPSEIRLPELSNLKF
jgi:hypothetical protein